MLSYVCENIVAKMTIQERIEMSLRRSSALVFARNEFDKFGGYDQVGRALRSVMAKGLLIRAGYGLYVKTRISSLSGKPIPALSLIEVGLQALEKLGIKAELGRAAKAYRDGATSQMPMSTVLDVGKSRVTRKIGFAGKSIRYEKQTTRSAKPD